MRRILILAAIWGWSFVFIKVAVKGMTPATMAAARCALGAVVLLVVCRATARRLPSDPTAWRHMAVMGLMYSALPFTLLGWAEQRTTSALAAVCQADTPLFTALFAAWLIGARLKRPHLIGLIVGFAGVAVCAGIAGGDVAHSSTGGALAAAASGASYGFAFTYAKRHLGGLDPIVAATGQVVFGALFAAPLAIVTSIANPPNVTLSRLAAITILGVVGTGIAYSINYASIADVGATRASLVTYLVPVVAVAVGIIVLGEPFQLRVIAGGAIIVAGIALVQDRVGAIRRIPILAALVLGACSAGGVSAAPRTGCSAPTHDRWDPRSVVHILPGATPPPYLTNPPTSGEHQPVDVNLYRGIHPSTITPQVQVALLESSLVLVQYRPGTDTAALSGLTSNPDVTMAPDPDLPSPVVASAWTWRLVCAASPRLRSIQDFVQAHAGNGPQPPPPR